MGHFDERITDDIVTASRIGKPTGRRLHSDMSAVRTRLGTSSSPQVRKTSCFWKTVLNTDPPNQLPPRQSSNLHNQPRARSRPLPPRPVHVEYRQQPYYHQHMFFEHEQQQAPMIEQMAGHRCHLCGAMFRSTIEVTAHKQIKHMRQVKQPRPHKCPRCDISFSQRSHLNQHVRTVHEKHKPFKCDKCDKSFGKRFDLNSHVDAVHANERPHACKYCSKKFAKRSNLTRHVEKLHPRFFAAIPFQRRQPPY